MSQSYNITGATGSTLTNSNVAGVVHGGMGNTTNDNKVDRQIHNAGTVQGIVASGESAQNTMAPPPAASSQTDPKKLTSAELAELLRQCECLPETIKCFTDKKITGRLFLTKTDEIIQKLEITDEFEIMKLEDLKTELNK